MSLTKEQQRVVDTVMEPGVELVKVEACAGAGKTHTLIEAAKALNPKTGLYLAYNKAIATEAADKFAGTTIQCSTVHSIAYKAVVRQWGLSIGWFGYRDIKDKSISFRVKLSIVKALEGFLSSEHITPDAYFAADSTPPYVSIHVSKYLDLMANASIPCTHSFYLKMYHVLLVTGKIPVPELDLLMVDEAGDLTAITLDIFTTIKAKKKLMVGDSMQNIYSFNNTINGFEELKDVGTTVKLTQSFRVSNIIASKIEGFVRRNLDDKFEFKGREYPTNYPITTRGFIARTNGALLGKMIDLKNINQPFHTTRKIDAIIALPIILANLGNGSAITDTKFKQIEKARKEWEQAKKSKDMDFLGKYSTPLKYVLKTQSEDREISAAAYVLSEHGPHVINSIVAYAKDAAKYPCEHILTTAHSSKGLEFDAVELAEEFITYISTAKENIIKGKKLNQPFLIDAAEEEYRLFYVACSRALVSLTMPEKLETILGRGIVG